MKYLLAVIALWITSDSYSGTAALGKISKIHFMGNGVIIFNTSGHRVGAPSCATHVGRFAIDGKTDGGKVQASGILAMYMAGKEIRINGTGSCSAWSDTETVSYFRTDD